LKLRGIPFITTDNARSIGIIIKGDR